MRVGVRIQMVGHSFEEITLTFPLFFSFLSVSESVEEVTLELNVVHAINSPNFPRSYPSNAFIEWSFTGPPGTHIILTILSHHTETDYDYVNFGHGHDSADMGSLIARLEGSIDQKILYSTNSNEMWMYFVSDYSVEEAGFQFEVTAANPGGKLLFLFCFVLFCFVYL